MIAAAAPQWRLLLLLAIRTGLRLGELRALRWQDVHLAEGLPARRREPHPGRDRHARSPVVRGPSTSPATSARASVSWPAARPPAASSSPTLDGSPLSAGQVYRATQAAARASGSAVL